MNATIQGFPETQRLCLFQYSQTELDNLFESLPQAEASQFNGAYRGKLFAILGFNWLPRLFRKAFYRLLATVINPWRGKYFSDNRGANYWFHNTRGAHFGFYQIEADDQGIVTQLNYDVPLNAQWLKGVRGEVRSLKPGVFLARMNYQTKAKTIRVLYFTLKAAD